MLYFRIVSSQDRVWACAKVLHTGSDPNEWKHGYSMGLYKDYNNSFNLSAITIKFGGFIQLKKLLLLCSGNKNGDYQIYFFSM